MKWGLKKSFNKENDQADQELKILEEDIAAARDFIRNNRKNYFQGKKNIPIYLILGPSRFGKSTLLSQAGLDLISTDLQKMGKVTPTKYCSFWFTKEAIYIDTAGTYTKPDITTPRHDLIWQGFIKLLQKYFGKDAINGTLIILDLPAIVEDEAVLKKTLFCVRERIYEMAGLVKTLTTHIVFTKCDRIAGFIEFFSILDTEERLEPFGLSLTDSKKTDLVSNFETKFNQLIKNLNNRIAEHLQKTSSPAERKLIKTFPTQIDHLRQTLIEVIGQIPHSNQILLSGMYFTSSIQTGSPIDPVKATLFRTLSLRPKNSYMLEANNNRSYFIEDIFKKAINLPKMAKNSLLSLYWLQTEHVYAATIIAVAITISSIVAYQSYQKNLILIDQTQYALTTKNIEEPKEIYYTAKQLENDSHSWWLTFGVDNSKKLHRVLIKTHQNLFIHALVAQLENYLTYLNQSQNPEDQSELYRALKTYLMLGNPKKANPSYIKSWLSDYWQNIYRDNQQISELKQQLVTVLQYKLHIQLNQSLIASIRSNLNSLPSEQLIYLLLENTFAKRNIDIGAYKTISKIYLAKNFHKVYNTVIPNIVNRPPKYDEVIGKLNLDLAEIKDKTRKDLQKLYIERYVLTWIGLLKPETETQLNNINAITQYLTYTSHKNSKLLKILKQIQLNTQIDNPPAEFSKKVNKKLPEITKLNLENIQGNLHRLANYLQPISTDIDTHQKAFNAAVQYLQNKSKNPLTHFRNFALTQPIWLQQHLMNIAEKTWEALLSVTYLHIVQGWNQQVIPQYNATLANKYPIFENSKNDIEPKDFNSFFAPRGTMDTFFEQYLNLFVNADKTNWNWKTVDNKKINFPSDLLETFLRAAMIQKMFYSNKKSEPKLNFALTPQEMTPNTISFNLNIEGQKLSFDKENKTTKHLVWPGPKPNFASISFVNNQGRYFFNKEQGAWAWFRILDKSNVTSSNNTRHFQLTFDLNGNAIKYLLSTTNSVNPFIPEIINNFRCIEIEIAD